MKSSILFLTLTALALNSCAQKNGKPAQVESSKVRKTGGRCEGCEAIYSSPVPFERLSWMDTLPDFNEPGPKMIISGVVYQADGVTPAKDVVLYVYHTDQTGHYTNRNREEGYAGIHGYIKGWMKTNEKGAYRFYTLKPAPYPGMHIPAHIHPVIKEPGINDYWIDEYLFDDDPNLTAEEKKKQQQRGGNGIIRLQEKDGILYGERNIYLGKNIPDYPANRVAG
jgi:protocatechuate 3,4-dioxygenase beta subunit